MDTYYMTMSAEEELSVFRDQFLITREEILARIETEKEELKISEKRNEGFRMALLRMYDELYEQVHDSMLFDAPDGFWHYAIEYDSMGLRLKLLNETGYVNEVRDYIVDEIRDEYTMITIPSKFLTIEEYATLYGVETVTVRQWIRRGKIRSAFKAGNEWRIPELTDIPNKERGYHTAKYSWNMPLEKNPEGFSFINKYNYVSISRNGKDYSLKFWSAKNISEEKEVACDVTEKEKLELFLISNPYVKYEGEISYAIDRKC